MMAEESKDKSYLPPTPIRMAMAQPPGAMRMRMMEKSVEIKEDSDMQTKSMPIAFLSKKMSKAGGAKMR